MSGFLKGMPIFLGILGIVVISHPTPLILDKQLAFRADVMQPEAQDGDRTDTVKSQLPYSMSSHWIHQYFWPYLMAFETHLNLYGHAPLRTPLLPSVVVVLLFCFHCSIYDLALMD